MLEFKVEGVVNFTASFLFKIKGKLQFLVSKRLKI